MAQWLVVVAVVAAALVCPAMMWLGRRGVGPGCAMCPPNGEEDELDALRSRQRALAAQVRKIEAEQTGERDPRPIRSSSA